ncbi:hypothetical protein AAG906_034451 [Vitis piasezkii]
MLSIVRSATLRKCIDVPFNRNYVPTWVFDHTKSYNGGTFIVFYLSSQNSKHDEIDFEFSRNKFGQRFILQTNVFMRRK